MPCWNEGGMRTNVGTVLALLICMLVVSSCGNRELPNIASGDPHRGEAALFRYGCGACHTIAGLRFATGLVGPPLSNIGRRMYVAGMLRNTPENLELWIRHPRDINAKTAMPDTGVTERDAIDIAAYFYAQK